jgi:hypothetical protein
MSKENKKTIPERIKLFTVNFLLKILEKLLAKEITQRPNPPINPNNTPAIQEEIKFKLGEKLDPVMFADPDLLSRDIDFDVPPNGDDVMGEFDLKIKEVMDKYLENTSALVVAGPLMANGLKLYRTVLTQEEYDSILTHIYQTRNAIKPIMLPQNKNNNTVH